MESSPSKTTKSPKKSGSYRRLQLYNTQHAKDISTLLKGVKPFTLSEEKEEEEEGFIQASDNEEEEEVEKEVQELSGSSSLSSSGGKLTCSNCSVGFDDVQELRRHCKLDWHRYNVKRRLHGEKAVTEGLFDEMMDDLSSIEGSDSENEDTSSASSTAVSRLMEKLPKAVRDNDKSPSRSSPVRRLMEKTPKAYFENEAGNVFGLYKSVAEALSKSGNQSIVDNILKKNLRLAIIMVSGGHFAAAIFQGGDVLVHKTFHSYTVRAKQGGSQGSKDNKSATSHPKSAGASLRRYNEQSFMQHVQDLLQNWKSHISECPVIFYRAAGSSGNTLFGGKTPCFQRNDAKLRVIPFPTKRPTFTEVKRVHSFLTVLHVYDNREQFLKEHLAEKPKSPKKKPTIDRTRSRSPKIREDPWPKERPPAESDESSDSSVQDIGPTEIIEESGDFSHLKEYDDSLTPEQRKRKTKKKKPKKEKPEPFPKPPGSLGLLLDALTTEEGGETPNIDDCINRLQEEVKQFSESDLDSYINQPVDDESCSLLHIAAQKNSLNLIWTLLELGCNPSVKNKSGKVPYNCAMTKQSRDEFRRFMGRYPDKFDYKKAHVPTPLTEDLESEQTEKKKMLNKLKREKQKLKKLEQQAKEKEESEKDRFLNLSDREKRALAAEQRILAQYKRNSEKAPVLVRCFECGCDMTGKVPFEYNQNVFCTTTCLGTHRKKFPARLPQ